MVVVSEHGPEILDEYARIPIRFQVKEYFQVQWKDGGLGGMELVLREVDPPFIKDHDRSDPVIYWKRDFDLSNWVFLMAEEDGEKVGAAAIAYDTKGVHMLQGRKDITVLWDIRVSPEYRGGGVGSALFTHAAEWSRKKNCRLMKVETQNINVPACRFYAKQGCYLGSIDIHAYPKFENEVCLMWYLPL